MQYPNLAHHWSGPESSGKRVLHLPKQDTSGFDIRIECEPYGLYPYAGDWHGATWDANAPNTTIEEQCEQCLGFVRSLLCPDSKLSVTFAGTKPIKWVLTYPIESQIQNEETGLLLFNYFVRRHTVVYQNHHLPSRASSEHAA